MASTAQSPQPKAVSQGPTDAKSPALGLRASALRLLAAVRRIVGVPDYDAYVRHMRAHHPDQEPVTPDAFLRTCWEEKYSRPGHRCC
jgi:uncharacterized short protein YbdD (DUF466 family)